MDAKIKRLLNLTDFEKMARQSMPRAYFDYYAGGAGREATLRENCRAFDRIKLRHRILAGIKPRNLEAEILGANLSMPILVAPTALHTMATPEGELATARASAQAQTIMCVSTIASYTLESVSQVTKYPLWFQLYILKDRGFTRALIERVRDCGYKAIELTVDAPVLGVRERDVHNDLSTPSEINLKNLNIEAQLKSSAPGDGSALANQFAEQMDPSISWRDIEWVKSVSGLPVLVKGVVHPQDALLAVEHGADGIVVSNHGGRQLDGGPATIDVLPGVREALKGRSTVLLMDGGIRRGVDVLKALVLGADAVQVGRAALWGLAVDGENGVVRVLELLRSELDTAMALCGFSSLAEIRDRGRDLLQPKS